MNEYWEITRTRGVATQAVWGMQPTFKLNKLTITQHAALSDSLPVLAQTRDDREEDLTVAIAAKTDIFTKLENLGIRVPGVIDGLLEDEDDLKDQLDDIYGIDPTSSENAALRRARKVFPLWSDVDAARAAAVPPEPPLTIDYQGVAVDLADFTATIAAAIAAQTTEAQKQRLVTNSKSALRTADRKTDRANKRWYKSWLKAYPEGTPEGDAALSQIPTEQGTPPPLPLIIQSATPLSDRRVRVTVDPTTGQHATTKELQSKLPGETEFGHATPITGNEITVGPYAAGAVVSFRTRVSNSNPGVVTSPAVTVVIPSSPTPP